MTPMDRVNSTPIEAEKARDNLSVPGNDAYEKIRPIKLAFIQAVRNNDKLEILDTGAQVMVEAYVLGIEYACDRILGAIKEEESV